MGDWICKWGWVFGVACLPIAGLNFYGYLVLDWGIMNLMAGFLAFGAGIFNIVVFLMIRTFNN